MKKFIAIIALCVFGILSANTLANDTVQTNLEVTEQPEVIVRAYRATNSGSEPGPPDAYFATSACRAIFLTVHPGYYANGVAMVDELLVFVCI